MEGSLQVYKLVVKIGKIHFPRFALEKEKEILFQSSDFLMVGNKDFGCFMSSSKNFILLELKKLLMFTKVLVQVAVEEFQKHEDKFLEEFLLTESFWKRNRAIMLCKTFMVWFNVPYEGTSFLKASVLISKDGNANGKGYSWNGVHEFLFKLWCCVFEEMEENFLDKKKDENDALSHVSSAKLQILKPTFDGLQVPSRTRHEEEDRLNPLGNLLENFGSLLKHGELPEMEHDIFEQGMLVHYVLCDVGVCFVLVNGFKVSDLLFLESCCVIFRKSPAPTGGPAAVHMKELAQNPAQGHQPAENSFKKKGPVVHAQKFDSGVFSTFHVKVFIDDLLPHKISISENDLEREICLFPGNNQKEHCPPDIKVLLSRSRKDDFFNEKSAGFKENDRTTSDKYGKRRWNHVIHFPRSNFLDDELAFEINRREKLSSMLFMAVNAIGPCEVFTCSLEEQCLKMLFTFPQQSFKTLSDCILQQNSYLSYL